MSKTPKKSDIQNSGLKLTLSFDKIHTCPLCTSSILEWYNEARHNNFDFCRRNLPNPVYHNAKECEGEYILLETLHHTSFSDYPGIDEPVVETTDNQEFTWSTPDKLRPLVIKEFTRLDNLRLKNGFSKIRSRYTNFTKKILQDIISIYLTADETKFYWNIRRTLWPHQLGGRASMRGS